MTLSTGNFHLTSKPTLQLNNIVSITSKAKTIDKTLFELRSDNKS